MRKFLIPLQRVYFYFRFKETGEFISILFHFQNFDPIKQTSAGEAQGEVVEE